MLVIPMSLAGTQRHPIHLDEGHLEVKAVAHLAGDGAAAGTQLAVRWNFVAHKLCMCRMEIGRQVGWVLDYSIIWQFM